MDNEKDTTSPPESTVTSLPTPKEIESPFQYLIDQEKTWRSLRFNEFMERPLKDATQDQLSGDLLSSLIDKGTFDSYLLKTVDVNKIANAAIANAKINPTFRAFKAVVAKTGGDFTNLQSAIDYVNSLGGGVVFVKPGIYILTANLILYSNVHIIGEDRETTIISFNESTAYNIQIQGSVSATIRNVRLENLQITKFGNSGTSAGSPPVQIYYADNIVIDKCKFYLNYPTVQISAALYVGTNDANNIFITRNIFDTNRSAVKIVPSTGNNIVVSNNKFTTVTEAAIAGGASDFLVSENYFTGCGSAVDIQAGASQTLKRIQVVSNIVVSTTNDYNDAIDVINFGTALQDVVIANNVVDSITDATTNPNGISVSSATRIVIVGNTIRACDGDGIKVTSSDNCIIDSNVSTGNGGYGVNVSNAASDNTIVTNNQLSGNTAGSLNDAGTSTTAANNEL